MTTRDLRAMVREALDNLTVNGFDPSNKHNAEYLARDMCELDVNLEHYHYTAIMPYVQEWLIDRQR